MMLSFIAKKPLSIRRAKGQQMVVNHAGGEGSENMERRGEG